jgi:hypothetical protein
VDPHTVDAFMLLVEQQRAADARPATVCVHTTQTGARVSSIVTTRRRALWSNFVASHGALICFELLGFARRSLVCAQVSKRSSVDFGVRVTS